MYLRGSSLIGKSYPRNYTNRTKGSSVKYEFSALTVVAVAIGRLSRNTRVLRGGNAALMDGSWAPLGGSGRNAGDGAILG